MLWLVHVQTVPQASEHSVLSSSLKGQNLVVALNGSFPNDLCMSVEEMFVVIKVNRLQWQSQLLNLVLGTTSTRFHEPELLPGCSTS